MTRQETLMMMGLLKVAYPQYYARQSREEVSAAVGLWQMMFEQDEAQAVAAAVKAFIATDTKGFPPGIGQIKENLDKLRVEAEGGELTAMEAWQLVRRAIGNSYYHAAEEFEKLPDTVRAVLGGPSALHDYANMDEATVNSVVASHFQRSFAARRDHAAQMRKFFPFLAFRRNFSNFIEFKFPSAEWKVTNLRKGGWKLTFRVERCLYCQIAAKFGCEELSTVFCDYERVAFAGLNPKIGAECNGSLADGHDYCEFVFTKGKKHK